MKDIIEVMTSEAVSEKAARVLTSASLAADAWNELSEDYRQFMLRDVYNGEGLCVAMKDLNLSLELLLKD